MSDTILRTPAKWSTRPEPMVNIGEAAALIVEYAKGQGDFPNRYAIICSARNIQRLCWTQPIIYRPSPLWKIIRWRLELALSNAIRWCESAFMRLCQRLDAHPVVVLLLLVACGYVGVLLAQTARHMAFGVW